MTEAKQKENKQDYVQSIRTLLDNYENGWDIFKKASDWTDPIHFKDGVDGSDLPQTWIALADKVISIIAHEKYGLDTYPNTIEIIDGDSMLQAYVSNGMPVSYNHWSFGKAYTQMKQAYDGGQMGLAYEIIINTNPSIAYCMEKNTKTMQMLVIAHASYGHNSFFKNNRMFKQFTQADNIIGDLTRMKEFIEECEEKYGVQEVEKLLDACHALRGFCVDHYTKPKPRTPEQEAARRAAIAADKQRNFDPDLESASIKKTPTEDFKQAANDNSGKNNVDREENLMRYIEENAPHLAPWQRKILNMFREKEQYFYPQRLTQVMNEGWASFWHYTILNDLHDLKLIDDGMALEFKDSHAGVLYQPGAFVRNPQTGQKMLRLPNFNPYALGFAIFQDIKRICLNPTEEDKAWRPEIAGNPDWLSVFKTAMENFKDESFIQQYLSPKVIRDFGLFALRDDDQNQHIDVTAIHDEDGYQHVRDVMAAQYRFGDQKPYIEVADYNYRGDRSLTLHHISYNRKPLAEKNTQEVLRHLYQLWGHPVKLHTVNENGDVINTIACPPAPKPVSMNPARKFI